MNHFEPMTTDTADELLDCIRDTIEAQPVELQGRLWQAIKAGLYDVISATPDQFVLDVRGIGELIVARVTLPPRRLDA